MKKQLMFISLVVAAVMLAACGGTVPAAALATGSTAERTVSVSGSGIAYGTPDVASTTIGVEVTDEDPDAALAEANERAEAIIAAIKATGVADEDIQTSQFSLYPRTRYDDSGNIQSVMYQVNYSLTVTFRDTAMIGQGLSAAAEAGANNISGVSFSVSEPAALMAEAREAAVADARERAAQLAEHTGATLGDVKTVVELSYGGPSPVVREAAMMESAGGVPIEEGQSSVQVVVEVTWLLTD